MWLVFWSTLLPCVAAFVGTMRNLIVDWPQIQWFS